MTELLLNNRLIGFFDILGFKARLETMPLSVLHAKYASYIDTATNAAFTPKELLPGAKQGRKLNFEVAKFIFDSVVVVSHPLTELLSAHDFMLATGVLYELGMLNQMPLRGAISKGDYLDDNERGIFLSGVFPDLLSVERAQEWSGCHLLPAAEEPVLESLYNLEIVRAGELKVRQSNPIIYYPVPFKGNFDATGDSRRWCLNWYAPRQDCPEFRRGLSYLTGVKERETHAFAQYIRSLPDDSQILTKEFFPAVRMRTQIARCGLRFAFFDAHGNPTKPENQFRIEVNAEQ